MWAARAMWVAVAVFGGAAIGQALADHSRPVQVTGTVVAWVAWAAVAMAMLLPSTIGLTVVRSIVPAGPVVAVLAMGAGAEGVESALGLSTTVLACTLVLSAEFGQVFAQGSAYGHERRFVLRPPLGFVVPAVASWCVLCAAAIAAPLLLAARAWLIGVPVAAVALAGGWFLGRRFHVSSRRWFVLVPAGVVVHDPLVLADTVMLPRANVVAIGLALADTQAADLTGPASGHAVEIALRDMVTVVLAPTRATQRGTALHVRSMLVAPSRPGRLLHAATDDRLPVG